MRKLTLGTILSLMLLCLAAGRVEPFRRPATIYHYCFPIQNRAIKCPSPLNVLKHTIVAIIEHVDMNTARK